MRWIAFSLVQSQKDKLGFRLSYHWHSKLCWECPHIFRNTSVETVSWVVGPGSAPQGQPQVSVPWEVGVLPCLAGELRWKAGSSGHLHCVVISFTIMLIIRDPLGQVHRSMLGFLILSWRSWSSSQRSSFTSSATCDGNSALAVGGFHSKASNYDYHGLRPLTGFYNTVSFCNILLRPVII